MALNVLTVQADWVPLWRAPFAFAWGELKQAFEKRFDTSIRLERESGSIRIGSRVLRLVDYPRDPPRHIGPFDPHAMKLEAVWSYGIASVSRQVGAGQLEAWARFRHVAAPFAKIAPDTWQALINDCVDESDGTAQVPGGPALFSIHLARAQPKPDIKEGKKARTQTAIQRAVHGEWPNGMPISMSVKVRDSKINKRLKDEGTGGRSAPVIRDALKAMPAKKLKE
jgi:hypothetical protein